MDDYSRPSSRVIARLRRSLRLQQDEELLERAVADGALSGEAHERLVAEAGDASPLQLARARAMLEESKIRALEQSSARDEFVRPGREIVGPPDAAGRAAILGGAAARLGHLLLVEPLGRGGTAEVWRAWDGRLGRYVAVKLAVAALESADARGRFEREAATVGRLDHPNILPVYQFGIADDGRPYLVMPLVRGRTLERSVLPPQEALAVIRSVAGAVAHAHAAGVVHRDLNPRNVMIDEGGQVFVLDFGLAFVADAGGALTIAGDVLGTAGFLSPEQAAGDADRARAPATDIWGLGATLYHLVTGRSPFGDTSLGAAVSRTLNEPPPSPRALCPTLDQAIEDLILHALEKDPKNRPPSAAAFCVEVDFVMAGADVPGERGRATRRRFGRLFAILRRRPFATAASLAIVLAIGVGALVQGRATNERRSAVAALRTLARISFSSALGLRRAGDLGGMQDTLPAVLEAYQRVAAAEAVTPEAEFLVGRMYRALLDDNRALEHQERALAADGNFGEALYERAVLLSGRYGERLARALLSTGHTRGLGRGPSGQREIEEIDPSLRTLRARIVADCERLETTRPSGLDGLAARAILAFHRQRYAEAESALMTVVGRDPLREEAWETLARSQQAQGQFEAAEKTFTLGLAHDRGYLPHLIGRCELRWWRDKWDEAIADASTVLRAFPRRPDALLCRGDAYRTRGHNRMMTGTDPNADFAAAEADFATVLSDANNPHALIALGTLARSRAVSLSRRHEDPTPALAASEEALSRSITLDAGSAHALTSRGRTRTRLAALRVEAGQAGPDAYASAFADLHRAVGLAPGLNQAHEWLGDLHARRASARVVAGDLPGAEEDFAAAEQELTRAIEAYDGDPWPRLSRGKMRVHRGALAVRWGQNPHGFWLGAQEDLALGASRPEAAEEATAALVALRAARVAASTNRKEPRRPN